MATLDHEQRSVDGATLVHLAVRTEVPARVEVEATVDGPVWPPRVRGVPEAGWTDDGWTGHVTPGRPTTLGFATPASPVDPPARIAAATPDEEPDEDVDPRDLVRTLGRQAPPRDAVPVAGTDGTPDDGTDSGPPAEPDRNGAGETRPSGRPTGASCDRVDDPAPLDAVERRLETAEALAAAESLAEAERALDRVEAVEGARELVADLEGRRRRLESAAARRRDLAARIAALDVPVAVLERLQ